MQTFLRRSPIDALLVLLLALTLLPGVAIVLLDLIPIPAQIDFAAYYLAAQALNVGQSPYDGVAFEALAQSAGSIPFTAYIYPPFFAALLRPLALLPFPIANTLWLVLNIAWYVVGIFLLARLLNLPRSYHVPLLTVSLFVPALHHTLELRQVNTAFLALLVGALVIIHVQRGEGFSGALLGFLGMVKLFPILLLLPLLPHQRWRAVGGFIAVLIGSAVLGIVAGGGLEETTFWPTEVLPSIIGGFSSPNNQSLLAAVTRLGVSTQVEPVPLLGAPPQLQVMPLIDAPLLLRGVGIAFCILVAITTIVVVIHHWRQGFQPSTLHQEVSLLLACTLLVTPVVWYHYYVLLLIPIGVGLRDGGQDVTTRRIILVGCLLLAIQRYWRVTILLGTPLLLSLGTLGTLTIWWALMRLVIGNTLFHHTRAPDRSP